MACSLADGFYSIGSMEALDKDCLVSDGLAPAKNRTTVGVRFNRRSRLAATALLGLAPVRSARVSAANHREASALAGMMTRV